MDDQIATPTATVTPTATPTAPTTTAEETEGGALITDELLVEEISIDGMCGVY